MNWNKLLADHRVAAHETNKQELDALRSAVARDLRDASLSTLSADTRFSLSYNAVLLLAKMAIACAGYRVKGHGAHHTTFASLELAMDRELAGRASYFNRAPQKRNTLTYDEADVVTDTEAKELFKKANEFKMLVEAWITKNHPELK